MASHPNIDGVSPDEGAIPNAVAFVIREILVSLSAESTNSQICNKDNRKGTSGAQLDLMAELLFPERKMLLGIPSTTGPQGLRSVLIRNHSLI